MPAHSPQRLILARLRLLPTEEGGRKSFIFSDYWGCPGLVDTNREA